MKIALVGPVYPFRGGIAHYTTLLQQALQQDQQEVLLISFSRQYPAWLFPGESDRDPSAHPLLAQHAQYWLDSLNPLTWFATFYRIQRFAADGLVLQWWTSYWLPVWLTLALLNRIFLGARLVILCHNVLPHDARWWEKLAARLFFRWGDHFIVQSAEEKARLQQVIQPGQVDIVPHPVYDLFVEQRIAKASARQQLQIPLDAVVLLSFGIVRKYKGVRDLLLALPMVKQKFPKVFLLIAGEFWESEDEYRALIRQIQLEENVQIENRYIPNEEIGLYFSAADAYVAAHQRKTGSGSLEVAKAFALPVISAEATTEGGKINTQAGSASAQLAAQIVQFLVAGSIGPSAPVAGSWQNLVESIKSASVLPQQRSPDPRH